MSTYRRLIDWARANRVAAAILATGLVVSGCLLSLPVAGFLLLSVQSMRDTHRRQQIRDNLQQLDQALQHYHNQFEGQK